MFFAVFKNLKSTFSEGNVPEHALDIFIENATKMIKVIPFNAINEDQNFGSTKTLHVPIHCNENYRGSSRNDNNAFGCDGYRFP